MKNILSLLTLVLFVTGCQPDESPDSEIEVETSAVEAESQSESSEAAAVETREPCEINMGWDPWEPYHYQPVGGQVQGLDIELVTAVAQGAGCELEFEQGSWASMLQLIRTGELDLLLGATRTPERESFAWFSEPYREETFRVFVRAEDIDRWSDMELVELLESDFRIGVTQGYIYSDEVSRLQSLPEYSDQFVQAAVGELNFTHLMDYRIDGFIEDPFVTTTIEHRRDWGANIEALPLEISSGEVHMMFSRKSLDEAVVERFNEALAELRSSSDYKRIMERYRGE